MKNKKTISFILGIIVLTCCMGLSDFSCDGTITGTVTNSGETGIEGATISTGTESFSATTDSNGGYRITGLPEGIYNVSASKDGYKTSDTVEVTIVKKFPVFGAEQTQDFTLLQNGSISGTVTMESTGNPYENAWVYLYYGNSPYSYVSSTTTNSVGYYLFSDISPDYYQIWAQIPDYISEKPFVTLENSGAITQDLALEPDSF